MSPEQYIKEKMVYLPAAGKLIWKSWKRKHAEVKGSMGHNTLRIYVAGNSIL